LPSMDAGAPAADGGRAAPRRHRLSADPFERAMGSAKACRPATKPEHRTTRSRLLRTPPVHGSRSAWLVLAEHAAVACQVPNGRDRVIRHVQAPAPHAKNQHGTDHERPMCLATLPAARWIDAYTGGCTIRDAPRLGSARTPARGASLFPATRLVPGPDSRPHDERPASYREAGLLYRTVDPSVAPKILRIN
jgi:hypothetical protein